MIHSNTATFTPSLDVGPDFDAALWSWSGYDDQAFQVDFTEGPISNAAFRLSKPVRGDIYLDINTAVTVTPVAVVIQTNDVFTNCYPSITYTNIFAAYTTTVITVTNYLTYYTNIYTAVTNVLSSSFAYSNQIRTQIVASCVVYTGIAPYTAVSNYGIFTNYWIQLTNLTTYITNRVMLGQYGSNLVENPAFDSGSNSWVANSNVVFQANPSWARVDGLGAYGSIAQEIANIITGQVYKVDWWFYSYHPAGFATGIVSFAGVTQALVTPSVSSSIITARTTEGIFFSGTSATSSPYGPSYYKFFWDNISVKHLNINATNTATTVITNLVAGSNLVITSFAASNRFNAKFYYSSTDVYRVTCPILSRTNIPPDNLYYGEWLAYDTAETNIARTLAKLQVDVQHSLYANTSNASWVNPAAGTTIGPPVHDLTSLSGWPFGSSVSNVLGTSNWITGPISGVFYHYINTNIIASMANETSTLAAVMLRGNRASRVLDMGNNSITNIATNSLVFSDGVGIASSNVVAWNAVTTNALMIDGTTTMQTDIPMGAHSITDLNTIVGATTNGYGLNLSTSQSLTANKWTNLNADALDGYDSSQLLTAQDVISGLGVGDPHIELSTTASNPVATIDLFGGGTIRYWFGSNLVSYGQTQIVNLVAGTTNTPTLNYIFAKSDGTFTNFTSYQYFRTNMSEVAEVFLMDTNSIAQGEGYARRSLTDNVGNRKGIGRVSWMGERIRRFPAQWESGAQLFLSATNISTNDVYATMTTGIGWQMHSHVINAVTNRVYMWVINDTSGFRQITNLCQLTSDSSGNSILAANGDCFAINILAFIPSGGLTNHTRLMISLSSDDYSTGSTAVKLANCIADSSSYDVAGVPVWMQGESVRLARVIMQRDSATLRTFTLYDKRGAPLGSTSGGGSSSGESDPLSVHLTGNQEMTGTLTNNAGYYGNAVGLTNGPWVLKSGDTMTGGLNVFRLLSITGTGPVFTAGGFQLVTLPSDGINPDDQAIKLYRDNGNTNCYIAVTNNGSIVRSPNANGQWYQVWDSNIDGAGSGLDADLLDGSDSSVYLAETSSLAAVTKRGALSGTNITLSVGDTSGGSSCELRFAMNNVGIGYKATNRLYTVADSDAEISTLYIGNVTNPTLTAGGIIWHSRNDGSGSGLDADLLDGLSSSAFQTNILLLSNSTVIGNARILNFVNASSLTISGGTGNVTTAGSGGASGAFTNHQPVLEWYAVRDNTANNNMIVSSVPATNFLSTYTATSVEECIMFWQTPATTSQDRQRAFSFSMPVAFGTSTTNIQIKMRHNQSTNGIFVIQFFFNNQSIAFTNQVTAANSTETKNIATAGTFLTNLPEGLKLYGNIIGTSQSTNTANQAQLGLMDFLIQR